MERWGRNAIPPIDTGIHAVFVILDRSDGWQDYVDVVATVDPVDAIVYGAVVYSGEVWDDAEHDWRGATKAELRKMQARADAGRIDAEIVYGTRSKLDKAF